MKKISYFLGFLLFIYNGFSQSQQQTDTIFEYKPANVEFEKILSDFILHEQNYDYYSSGITFTILFTVTDSGTSFILMSGSEYSAKFCDTTTFFIDEKENKFFIIHYDDHYFYSICRTNLIDTNLISRTGHFFKSETINKKKHCSENKNDISTLEVIFDDSQFETNWIYVFKNNIFYEVDKFSRTYGRKNE